MNLQGAPTFSADDYPDVSEQLLQRLTQTFDELYSALSQVPDRKVSTGSFVSAPSGVSSVTVKNPLAAKPTHVSLALRRNDLADFSAAWSWWWKMTGEQIQLSFVGLPASTRHDFSIELL